MPTKTPAAHGQRLVPAGAGAQARAARRAVPAAAPQAAVVDDRGTPSQPGDRVLLIVGGRCEVRSHLLDLAHDRGFKAVVSATGSGALPLVRRFNPSVITLDINLPDMDGWRLLDILKRSVETRHIPIHIISVDDPRERGLGQMGRVLGCWRSRWITPKRCKRPLARTEGVHLPQGERTCC